MNILVTGGLGLIGHNVVERLEKLGHNVIIADIATNYGIIPQDEVDFLICERKKKIKSATIYCIDISHEDEIEWLFNKHKPELVIHLASFPRQKVVNANPMLGSRAMSEGLLNLLEASVRHGVKKFAYTSSSMIYGEWTHCIKENEPTNPEGQYGIMKLAGEWLIRDYTRKHGMKHVIFRPSAVYGPLDVEDRVISKFLLTAMRGGTLKVNGIKEMLDFTYVDDAADGIVAASLTDVTDNKTYNITKSHSRSLYDAAQLAVKIAGKGNIEVREKDADFPSRGALDITAARQDFGFDPKVDVEEGFVRYYEWLQASPFWQERLSTK